MKKLIIVAIILLGMVGCTANQRAKQFGGTATIDLPANQKLVNVTWKDIDLWYLTRQMRKNESPESYEFVEDSSFGLIEGKVIFNESK